MKWKCTGILFLLFFAQLTGGATPARAASVYDTYIVPTDQLILHSDDTYYPCYNYQQDWSRSWTRWIYDPDFWSFGGYSSFQSDYIDAWEAAQTSGGWVITEAYGSLSDPSKGIIPYIVFSPSPLYLDWQFNAGVFVKASDNSALYSMPMQLFYYEGCSGAVWTPERPLSHPIGNSTPGGHIRLFAAGGSITPNYPTDYEGEPLSVTGSTSYVAMGDSFSSGEGNPTFEYGTNQGGANENRCHRSPQAYPRQLQSDLSLDLGPTAFVACAGATTSDVTSGKYGEDPQTDALSEDTEVVTITIGGNDVDFEGYANSCGAPGYSCGVGTTAYDDMMDRINNPSFETALEETYTTILDVADNAIVYVLDYPYLVDPTGVDGVLCEPLLNLSAAVPIQMALNSVIADAVDDVRNLNTDYERLRYMPTNYFGSPFVDHHLCTDDPGGSYFNGVNLSNREYSLHPNADGQMAYYQIMENYLS